jgi:hypothetical protein
LFNYGTGFTHRTSFGKKCTILEPYSSCFQRGILLRAFLPVTTLSMPPRKKQKVATAPLELTPEEQAIEDRKATYTISGSLTDTLTENQQREWLDRSRTWPSLAYGIHHQRWMPVKVLGGGKNGIVGLWRFQSRDGDDQQDAEENELDRIPKYMAIKQSGRAADSDGATDSQGADARLNMQWESKLLHQIMGTQTEHVIKIYKGYHLDGGSGVDPKIDPISFNEDGNYNTDLAVSRKSTWYDTPLTTYLSILGTRH